MKRILCARRMKACDKREILGRTPSEILMERAGKAVFDILCRDFDCSRVLFVCGGGNNGGDGLIAAMLAHKAGIKTHILFCGREDACTVETAKRLAEAKNTDVEFVSFAENGYTTVVDAMFGIGISRDIDGSNADIIKSVNSCGAAVLAVDIPSGICADNGDVLGCAVKADETVAIAAYKRGHILGCGPEYCGRLICVDIGIPTEDAEIFEGEDLLVPYVIEHKEISLLSKRPRVCNKGTFGRALIIGGAPGMCGAVYLSALAAYRVGAGIVEIFTSAENRIPLQTLLPEAIVTVTDWEDPETDKLEACLLRASSACIGPGMGMGTGALKLVATAFKNEAVPFTVDADALNLTAKYGLELPMGAVVTPHPLEFARLAHVETKEILSDLWSAATEYAARHEVICVAKDAFTAISDGRSLFVNVGGSPALAKGGSGDVLSGVITGLRCRDITALEAVVLGVYIHSLAGEKAEKKYGASAPLAREIADLVGEVLREEGR